MSSKKDPPASAFHIRVHKDISGILMAYKDLSGVAIAQHQPSRKDGRLHLHIWYQESLDGSSKCTKVTIKNRLKAILKEGYTIHGQEDMSIRSHDNFETWYRYVYGEESVRIRRGEATEMLYNLPQARPFELQTVRDLLSIESPIGGLVTKVRKSTETYMDRFIRKCWEEFKPKPDEEVCMGDIVEAFTSFRKNRLTPTNAKPDLQRAYYELNPHQQEAIRKANRKYFTSPAHWNGLTFYS